jgi:hypothetical protein
MEKDAPYLRWELRGFESGSAASREGKTGFQDDEPGRLGEWKAKLHFGSGEFLSGQLRTERGDMTGDLYLKKGGDPPACTQHAVRDAQRLPSLCSA